MNVEWVLTGTWLKVNLKADCRTQNREIEPLSAGTPLYMQHRLPTPSITAASLELRDIGHRELRSHKKAEERSEPGITLALF